MKLSGLLLTITFIISSTIHANAEIALSKLFAITKPVGGREFVNPQAICADTLRGDVYVADTGNGRLSVMNKDGYGVGGFIHKSSGKGEESSEPVGAAVDSKGRIYVTDSVNSYISVYDYRGRLIQKYSFPGEGEEAPAFGRLAVDSKDNLYAVVRNKGMIYVLDPGGALQRKIGSKGKGEGRFEMLADVCVDSLGNIYAVDSLGSPTVQVFDQSGKRLFGFGIHSTGSENFSHPTSIEVDRSGRIWITDSFAQAVKVYDSRGRFVTDFGGFFVPIDLAFSSGSQRLYVLEKTGHRLQCFEVK